MQKRGAFGRVVFKDQRKKQRVLKIPYTDDPTTRYIHALKNEAYVLDTLTKKGLTCIPHYYGETKQAQKGFPALQMQYLTISQSDVRSYLKDLSPDEFRDFLMRCFACLEELHKHLLHMDLHPGNIMFRRPTTKIPYPQLVFIDFGVSVFVKDVLRNYPSSDVKPWIELYKKYERYQLYSILVGMYEDQQQQQLQHQQEKIKVINSIPDVPHRFYGTKEADMAQEFHDTCNQMVKEGRWQRHS
jgi:serine/threonine protein kinase